jgi:hypothetical protein
MRSDVLGAQLEDYAGRGRFGEAVLGVISLSDRIATVAAWQRTDGAVAPESSLVAFFLGVMCLGRTLRATVTCDDPGPTAGAVVTPLQPSNGSGILR